MVTSTGFSPIFNRFLKGFLADNPRGARNGLNLSGFFVVVPIVLGVLVLTHAENPVPPQSTVEPRVDQTFALHTPQTLPDTTVARAEISMLAPLINADLIEKNNLAIDQMERVADALRHPIRLLNSQNYPLSLRDLVSTPWSKPPVFQTGSL